MLATADQVRTRISDRWRWAEEVRLSDGTASAHKLAQGAPFSNLSAVSAYLATNNGWSATAAVVDTGLGLVTLAGVVSAQTALRFDYRWAVFSDEEVGTFTAIGGSVAGAALQAVRALLFDAARRSKWAAPDGTEYDDTAAQKHLLTLEERLVDEVDREQGSQGGIESWSEQQAYWSTEYGA